MTIAFLSNLRVGSIAESLLSGTYTLMSPAPKPSTQNSTQNAHKPLKQLHDDDGDGSYSQPVIRRQQNGDGRSHKQSEGKRRKLIDRLGGNGETHDQSPERPVKRRKLSSEKPDVVLPRRAKGQVNGRGKATNKTVSQRPRPRSSLQEIEHIPTTPLQTSKANELLKPTLGPESLSQPLPADPKKNEKRSLRSHDGGSRSKSELSLYFPNWDSFVSNEQAEQDPLVPETRLFITDEPTKASQSSLPFVTETTTFSNDQVPTPILDTPTQPQRKQPDLTIRRIKLPIPSTPLTYDPLPDSTFEKLHGKSERREKQLRNIEKERAQHEKFQLECLYDSLRGPDWLKVMGISGIVESDRKLWEGKREWAIREVGALLRKFKAWKEEEKRLRDEAMEAEDESEESEEESEDDKEEEDEEEQSDSESEAPIKRRGRRIKQEEPKPENPKPRIKFRNPVSQTAPQTQTQKHPRTHDHAHPPISLKKFLLPLHAEPIGPFTSFFANPHQRAQALNPSNRSRTVLAFGHVIPELVECEFSLPDGFTTEEMIRERARERRRLKRTGKDP